MLSPIKPSEVVGKKREITPDYVIEAFNELIAGHWDGNRSTFGQRDAVSLIIKKGNEAHACIYDTTIYENHWLDVEEIYRQAGWFVEYDKLGYNETYEPTFTFRLESK